MIILFIIKRKILMLIRWSYRCPLIVLTNELMMIIILQAHIPIYFKYMFFWYPFMKPLKTTYHSDKGLNKGCLP